MEKKYKIEDAALELIGIVDNLFSIVKKQNLNIEDFEAAKIQFNKFTAIRHKMNDNDIPFHTNDN